MINVYLPAVVGKGYKEFWNSRARTRLVIGGRASKKSTTMALWLIYNIMKMPLANAVVLRRYYNTHRTSTFEQLLWAINRLGVKHLWKAISNPLELTYLPTGQKIFFRGFDNSESLTSMTVSNGVLCWAWVEEAYQLEDETENNKFELSIRGQVPEGYFKSITLTMNP